MKRARVLAEIESLEQAKRVEETVKTGYAETTQDEIVRWMAVEEDLANSYGKLQAGAVGSGQRDLVVRLREESEKNIGLLGEILEKIKALDAQRTRRIEEISRLAGEKKS